MLWKLKYTLFGWHYVTVIYGRKGVICRVRRDGNDQPYVRLLGEHIDLRTTTRDWFSMTINSGFLVPYRMPGGRP